MPNPAEVGNPFERLRARWLIALGIATAVVVYTVLASERRLVYVSSPLDEWIRFLAAIVAATAVLLGVATRAGVDLYRLFGGAPRREHVVVALCCAAWLVPLPLGGFMLLIAASRPQDYLGALPSAFALEHWASLPGLAVILLVVLVVPVCEEFVFRGLLLHRWVLRWRVRTAILAQAILFGMLHVVPIPTAVYAYVFAVLYLRTGSLWVPTWSTRP
jgi:uncharacterized protein